MNVYYCDVCGVRVTDTDLHSGHGMRRRHDVVCAACLELGHGKELLGIGSDKAERKQLAYSGTGAGASAGAGNGHAGDSLPPSRERPAGVDPLAARDRINTQNEDDAPAPIKPMPVLADTTPPHGESEMFEDTAKVPILVQDLGSTAAGFAALTPPPKRESDTGVEDVIEVPSNRLEDHGIGSVTPASGPSSLAEAHEDAEDHEHASADRADAASQGASEVSIEETPGDDDPEKAETTSSGRVEGAPAKKGDAKSSSTARRATSSSRVSKQTKSRSGRRKKDPNRQLIIYSAIGMGSILLIFGVYLLITAGGGSGKKKASDEVYSINKELEEKVAAARAAEATAFGSPTDVSKSQEAIALIKDMNAETLNFEKVAKEKGWTDDQIDEQMEHMGISDIKTQQKRLEDQIIANSSH